MIGLLKDGDEIYINTDEFKIEVNLSDEEIEKRKKEFTPKVKDVPGRWLKQYRLLVSNASHGAVLKTEL